ncbi:MAG: MFS transporter [Chloroflexota bacterium]|nr:MFS transporter [Chloroflexota bacterium]
MEVEARGSSSNVEPVASIPPLGGQAPPPTEQSVPGKFDLALGINYSVANLGASVVYGLFNFALPPYLATYNLHPSLIGLLANERSFVGAFVQPVIGRISDRTRSPLGRRRPFFLIGIPLMAVALMLLALHPPFWIMFGVMTVSAFFLAIAWDPYMAMMADLFPPAHRGRIGGLIGVGTALGNIIFALMAYFLIANGEFLVFGVSTAIMLVCWAYTFFTVKEPAVPVEPDAGQKMGKITPRQYLSNLRAYPEAAKYTLAILFFWLGSGGAVPFITLFGSKVLGASDSEVFLLPLAATVSMLIFAVPWGMFADRTSKKTAMTLGLVMFSVVALVGSQSTSLLQGTIALALIGVGNSAMSLINPMLVDLVPRKRTAEFVGLGSAVFSFAQPLGSAVAGAIVAVAEMFVGTDDAYRWAFIFAALMTALAALLLRAVRPERFVDTD